MQQSPEPYIPLMARPNRLPNISNHVATTLGTTTSTTVPPVAANPPTRSQLLATLRSLRVDLGWRLRGRQRAVPRTNVQLIDRIQVLTNRLRRRTTVGR